MEISEELKRAYDRLSVYNLKFLRYVEETPGCLKRSTYARLLQLNHDVIRMQPWPLFLNRQTLDEIEKAAVNVLDLIKCIPFRIFSNDYQKISDYYEIPIEMVKYFFYGVTQEHFDGLLARGDFIMSPSGMKCIEYNINTNLGGMDIPQWESGCLQVPVIYEFMKESRLEIFNRNPYSLLFEQLVESARHRSADLCLQEEINIALVMPEAPGSVRMSAYQMYLDTLFNNMLQLKYPLFKGEVLFCDYSHLNIHASEESIFYKNKRVHILVEWCEGFVPTDILALFEKGRVLIYNGAIAWFLSTKLNFALLSEHEDSEIFTPEERETIKKHIPWTRKITDSKSETTYKGQKVKLVDFVLSNREQLVLKPLVGSGGKDIYVGHKTSEDEWRQVVEKSLKGKNDWKDLNLGETMTRQSWSALLEKALNMESWLVQEYVDSYPFVFQTGEEGYTAHQVSWGFFVFGHRYGGGVARVLPLSNKKGVVNSHQGAEVSLLFEVKD
jgi:hypothetical protein